LLFTDPRQFMWVWEMADEINQMCPITYWHVWDNDPMPAFNKIWYDSTDLINCLSYKTYEMVKPLYHDKTEYIPHTFPKEMYFPMSPEELAAESVNRFGHRADWFKVLWVNRNATRKLPGDVIAAFKEFLDALEQNHGHRKAMLVMHTDPHDPEGPNLLEIRALYGLEDHVWFSTDKLEVPSVNLMHNLCDVLINIAKNEGFGLSTLIQMMVGKPIIALTTGGMTRQVVDYRDGTEHGVAIPPATRVLVGSQMVPYIYEDLANHQQIVAAFLKIYEMTPEEKSSMKKKVLDYVDHEFNFDNMIQKWDNTLSATIESFKKNKPRTWEFKKIENPMPQPTPQQVAQQVLQQQQVTLDPEVAKLPVDLTGHLLKALKITKAATK
jgi:glycosyltransferase involved in cell wall biosynthesis